MPPVALPKPPEAMPKKPPEAMPKKPSEALPKPAEVTLKAFRVKRSMHAGSSLEKAHMPLLHNVCVPFLVFAEATA